MPRKEKLDKNQLNIEFDSKPEPSVINVEPEKTEDKKKEEIIMKIFNELDKARERQRIERERAQDARVARTSIKEIRASIEKEQAEEKKRLAEQAANEANGGDNDDKEDPGEEIYGRFSKFKNKK